MRMVQSLAAGEACRVSCVILTYPRLEGEKLWRLCVLSRERILMSASADGTPPRGKFLDPEVLCATVPSHACKA